MISCSSVPQQNQNIEREWMMVSFENFSKTELMNSSAKIIFKRKVILNLKRMLKWAATQFSSLQKQKIQEK